MTTNVNTNNNKIIVGLAAIIAVAIIASMAISFSPTETMLSPENIPEKTNPSSAFPESPVSPGESYAKELLEKNTKIFFGEDYLAENTNLVKLRAKYHNNELLWSTNFEVVPNNRGGMKFGLKDGSPKNAFYGGPVIMWYKTGPDAEIEYSGAKMVEGLGPTITITDVVPYEWGLVYHETPPPQILKIMSDNDITLHY